jgi:hypothetical protein
MGTSSSSRGTPGGAPLVPPWADTDGKGPGPVPDLSRFQAFRTGLGRFVASGNHDDLRGALGHYARTSTGGSGVGARRFGSMSRAGGALFGALNDFRNGGNGVQDAGVDLSALNGADTDLAIAALAQSLAPPDGDGEKIKAALNIALSECLEGLDNFDFTHITDDMLVSMMLAYVRECVFIQVITDSDRAFQRADSATRAEQAEQDLHALVEVVVDKQMRPLFSGDIRTLSRARVEAIQLRAIQEVWTEWESY